jgi:hypothetical protein
MLSGEVGDTGSSLAEGVAKMIGLGAGAVGKGDGEVKGDRATVGVVALICLTPIGGSVSLSTTAPLAVIGTVSLGDKGRCLIRRGRVVRIGLGSDICSLGYPCGRYRWKPPVSNYW